MPAHASDKRTRVWEKKADQHTHTHRDRKEQATARRGGRKEDRELEKPQAHPSHNSTRTLRKQLYIKRY